MIPKTLHFIWVGDESKRPDNCIATWKAFHPDWQVKIWGNNALTDREWINAAHMIEMSKREYNGVADMMRWEILYQEGGIVMDADSICLRRLDDDLLDCEAFACWESEMARPGLIAAGYFGSCAQNSFVGQIILDIQSEATVVDRLAWETVGPLRLTEAYRKYQYHALKIVPSYYFIPEHFTGVTYDGPGPIYAHQLWGSTRRSYDQIHLQTLGDAPSHEEKAAMPAPQPAPVQVRPEPAEPPRLKTVSSIEAQHDPYFVQKIQVSTEVIGLNRLDVFRSLCEGKRVMHIGCADWPITDPASSLHLALEPFCAKLDGFDIHAEALAALAPYTKGELYSRLEDITEEYDIVLVPEVMEHVPSVDIFLAQLDSLKAKYFLITVPDAFQCQKRHFEYVDGSETFVEIVHPDHNCWYTPFTFSNTLAKYTSWKMEKMWFFNHISLLSLLSKTDEHLLDLAA